LLLKLKTRTTSQSGPGFTTSATTIERSVVNIVAVDDDVANIVVCFNLLSKVNNLQHGIRKTYESSTALTISSSPFLYYFPILISLTSYMYILIFVSTSFICHWQLATANATATATATATADVVFCCFWDADKRLQQAVDCTLPDDRHILEKLFDYCCFCLFFADVAGDRFGVVVAIGVALT